MPQSHEQYTYRAGQKILLEKSPDQFVVRASPERLDAAGIANAERVSSSSSRVVTRAGDLEPMMSASRHIAPTHHAYFVAGTGEEFLITDRIFVTFRDAIPDEQVDAFAGRYGLIKKAAYTDRDYLFQLTDHTGMNPVKLVVKLTEEEPMVASAEHDLNQRMTTYQQLALPTDPSYAREWHLHTRVNDPSVDPRSSSRCEAAWQLLDHFGSADVVVGVTDDGCKLDHPDFDSPNKFAGWGYFRGERLVVNTDVDARPGEMYKPGANHGTACAGVIAGEADAVLTVGAAPGCRLLPIQWESSGPSLFISDSKLLTALNYAADKVDVLSNSWGIVPNSMWIPLVVNRITELARTGGRRGRGVVFLWAAGNENCPIQHDAAQDVPYTDGWHPSAQVWIGVRTARQFRNSFVGIPGLMHVAALASTAQRSHYSNYGTGILICAPTSNSHEYRRLTVRGLGVTTTTGSGGGVTDRFGGTSSATPLVAGVAALAISANPDLTAFEVVSLLKQTASKDLNLDGYPRTPPANFDPNPVWDVSPVAPFNSGNFQNNGDPDGTWSPWFGHGRVDAANAVAEALSRRVTPTGQAFRRASTPGLNIPDNNAAGVSDTLNFTEAGMILSVKATVDITHTYIGDLRVTLTAPSGTAVDLHNRNGGNADNIQRAFDLTSTPGLAALAGQSLQGNWKLSVQDLALVDVGRLNRWELEIEARTNAVVNLEESPGITIPDNTATGVERTLATNETGQVKEVEVSIDITHTYIGDLNVTLFSPAGTIVPLHQRTGQGADNIIRTYTAATTPALGALRGQPVQGPWRLRVADVEAIDVGKLNRWALKIVREP
jgi:subtilisin-like proprotein convertase family protein/subtilisin family serine protease